MTESDRVQRAGKMGEEFASVLAQLTDTEVEDLFMAGVFDSLLQALLDPKEVTKYPSIAEFLLAKRTRAAYIAILRHAITENYGFKGVSDEGIPGFVSPYGPQWFDDGVLFLEGPRPFEGFLGLYRNGKGSYAIAARSAEPGEALGPQHFEFIDKEEFNQRFQFSQFPADRLNEPILKLKALLAAEDNTESKYQELLQEYPWVLGAQYSAIQRHEKLDDRNIPDFTGIRVHDDCRDILEIKPPFAKLFNRDGSFAAEFYEYWDQAERYLDFARRNQDYLLREKGLKFDNPKCYLILGFNLSGEEIKRFRAKERMNPSIELRTYDDVLALMSNTIALVQRLRGEAA